MSTTNTETRTWARETIGLSLDSLDDLFENRVAAVRVPRFASVAECDAFCRSADAHGYDYYQGVVPPIGKIGITQFESGAGGMDSYFSKAREAAETLQRLTESSFDPLARVLAAFAEFAQPSIASQENIGSYFAGLVRQIRTALLHVDWGPLDAPGWEIGGIDAQLAWNIYLKAPFGGGECVVYNRQWRATDERLKLPDSYGYCDSVVAGAERLHLVPRVGDLVLFNSRNFHEVRATMEERITISSFVGRKRNGDICLWS